MAATASGTTMDAPSDVIVPETLITGLNPRDCRKSGGVRESVMLFSLNCQ